MSVRNHRSPSWLKKAKFGIFIHWGLYSVPAWAPMGESYAEWYWWNYNQKNSSTFDYHHQHFGEQFEYDQFLNLWKPTNFNPDLWLELIDKSGARYYVFTAKHHDGIALFDTGVTKRSTVHLLNVSYDFVNELMRKSKADYPHLKRGLYFSLPEWYHPSYRDESLGWHGPPRNPYTGAVTNYSGSKTINDFVNELQVPQLMELTEMHDPDILWCDIGGIHNSSVWQAQYFNQAMAKNKQVAVNDRCGDGSASDFTTIEYKSIIDMPTRFWEATRGMDPYSFGYNRATKPEEYASSEELIQTLIDTVAYGGNFLLNIGPDDSGTVPDVMVGRLVDIGNWLHMVDSAIFNTIPYWIRAKEDEHLRFTASEDGTTVYVFYLRSTNDVQQRQQVIKIRTPLPIISKGGATIRLLNDRNVTIYWNYSTKGDLELHYTNSNLVNTTYALIFEVKYF
ncbi:alpha-L-fucosidase-domain-containing protein [Mycotypha africana]|uniref:alpha-L-fucosidase-domain-containing protein n=1 Tax=Mycotypha africana TaxID=64632 RepID=UPI0022FFD3CB|nr:alpha-L-fucosidase-domain-containing protein [Mycotypha africana]KAI8984373.1 alpha-L-fucosidase-domain-containing protein [Mycotypha africana]